MATYVIKPGQLGGALRGAERGARRAVDRGIMRAAQRGKRRLIQATNEKKIPYLGQFKNSFQVEKRPEGTVLLNDAPHAGIVELGARPHPVSEEGQLAIAEWVRTKLLEDGAASHRDDRWADMKRPLRGSGPLTPMGDARYAAAGAVYNPEDEVQRITQAIVRKIRRYGQKGKFVFRDEIPMLTRFLKEEVERAVTEEAAKGPAGPRGGRR